MASNNLQSSQSNECSICMESLTLPCKLPCGHIFCFLCIKGSFNHSPRCSLCRSGIPPDLIDVNRVETNTSDEYVWLYKGNNGWWQYDDRTNDIIETEYRNNTEKFRIQISDQQYEIDFVNLFQIRLDDPSKKRRIKRDLKTKSVKGIAGISANKLKK